MGVPKDSATSLALYDLATLGIYGSSREFKIPRV